MPTFPRRTWGTAVEEILDRQDRTLTSDGDRVKRAICSAIEFLDREETWLHEARFSVVLAAGVSRYPRGAGRQTGETPTTGVPEDLLRIHGDSLTLARAGNASDTSLVRLATLAETEVDGSHLATDPGLLVSTSDTGTPRLAAWWQEHLVLAPAPQGSGDVLSGRYFRALGTPWAHYDGAAWKFYKPGEVAGGAEVTNVYPEWSEGIENHWFGALYPVMVNLAWHDFCVSIRATADQQQAFALYGRELESVRGLSAGRVLAKGIRPYFPGYAS